MALIISDNDGIRATIKEGGEVLDANNKLIGFINEDGASGDAYVYIQHLYLIILHEATETKTSLARLTKMELFSILKTRL